MEPTQWAQGEMRSKATMVAKNETGLMKGKLEIVAHYVQACPSTGFKKAHQLEKGPKVQVGKLTESQVCHSVGLVGSDVSQNIFLRHVCIMHVECVHHTCSGHVITTSSPRQVLTIRELLGTFLNLTVLVSRNCAKHFWWFGQKISTFSHTLGSSTQMWRVKVILVLAFCSTSFTRKRQKCTVLVTVSQEGTVKYEQLMITFYRDLGR